jgi:hypothetical protein
MRRTTRDLCRLIALLATVAVTTGAAASAAAAPARFSGCARGFDRTRHNPATAFFDIQVRQISCATAYRQIENFPGSLNSPMSYHGYTCRYRYSVASGGFDFLCTDGPRAYRFVAAGD